MPKNLEILTDYENIRFSLKFVSKINIVSGPLWTDLKGEKKAGQELTLKRILVLGILKSFLQFYSYECLRNFRSQNWISMKYQNFYNETHYETFSFLSW